MKKTAFVILALLSILFSGCATNSISPEKQKELALVKLGEFKGSSAAINDIDGTAMLDLFHNKIDRDVLPGKHKVRISVCRNGCVQQYYSFEAKAGLAYILKPGEIEVVDRFNLNNNVETLKQIRGASTISPYYTSDELKLLNAEREKQYDELKQRESELKQRETEAAAAALAVVTERRTKNLPLVKKIGARICQEKTEYVYVGYVESIANDKVQIRISDSYRKSTTRYQKSRPDGFSPSIIWDSPMNWDLCE